jgi:hypothetical protein
MLPFIPVQGDSRWPYLSTIKKADLSIGLRH